MQRHLSLREVPLLSIVQLYLIFSIEYSIEERISS